MEKSRSPFYRDSQPGYIIPDDDHLHSSIACERSEAYYSGRGAQIQPSNPYQKHHLSYDLEALAADEAGLYGSATIYHREQAKSIINRIESPDIPGPYSLNPYQGCEHGCVYCYARPSHQYWGFSSGIDFESRIIIKENAPALLEDSLRKPGWKPGAVMLSGNTDPYQPIERKLGITQRILRVLLDFRNPVSVITKNALILRDIPLLQEMASMRLVHVSISLTAGSDALRRELEPRSSSISKRLATIERLSKAGIPVNAMLAPIIPGLNSDSMGDLLRMASDAGATSAGYTLIRLPGPVEEIFKQWLSYAFPDRADKVLSLIRDARDGQLSTSSFGVRMKGRGPYAESLHALFKMLRAKYFALEDMPELDLSLFRIPSPKGQLSLF